ncbi:MAG TPA: hypothetical protein DEG17_11425 [Cyanobacteria bacterium UBA11149]|nr:hypothetical protein [Cyanobacteria bacterium UBA11367]HBE57459.1 hypothetical protein [Cyanobacteria bacterium UBA11366]HBK66062.1 hypothetical protein [Cyanobacteria bacterium UBA11166]HBR76774.1 hypothetical protein [Cyanobacteria bacterium UBA11159]HBS71535.1 hypothetical protein [Cyanobacteria bacterium UBA11153]HBW89457.1 hypothetical protein [Cyanobacteria bacterium UBA11149]
MNNRLLQKLGVALCSIRVSDSFLEMSNGQLTVRYCSHVNYQLSTVNCQLSTVNCQLSTINCLLME